MEQEMTYAQAIARVEQIVRAMQDASLDVDRLGSMVSEATALIALCQGKLKKAEAEVKKAVGDE
ncbi:MAG: exodeoxyribonuclease VII small subunit [Mucinivorans sp.]